MSHLQTAERRSSRWFIRQCLAWLTLWITGLTCQVLAQDPTDSLGGNGAPYYLTGTMVYTPANGDAPRRLRMAMFIGRYGGVSAQTERAAVGQPPFRYWSGYARPQPETGSIANKFYDSFGRRTATKNPDGTYTTVPLPDGLVAAGPLQPLTGIGDLRPSPSLGPLNFRLANHRASGGGVDPDGSTYAFDLREQTIMPPPDPGTFYAYGAVAPSGQIPIQGSLIITHSDGQVDRLSAGGYLDSSNSDMFIFVPSLSGQHTDYADFKGSMKYGELRAKDNTQVTVVPFGEEASGVLHIAPANRFLLPGVQNIAMAMHYGRLTGGCIADDGTAYSFVLTQPPLQVTTIGKGF